jgi:hypothetical protein
MRVIAIWVAVLFVAAVTAINFFSTFLNFLAQFILLYFCPAVTEVRDKDIVQQDKDKLIRVDLTID